MASPDFTIYHYDDSEDGQISSSTSKTSDWFDATGISAVLLQGTFTTGTTTVKVEQARSNTATVAKVTSADQFSSLVAGAKVNLAYEWFRIVIAQSTSNTTVAQLAAKGIA